MCPRDSSWSVAATGHGCHQPRTWGRPGTQPRSLCRHVALAAATGKQSADLGPPEPWPKGFCASRATRLVVTCQQQPGSHTVWARTPRSACPKRCFPEALPPSRPPKTGLSHRVRGGTQICRHGRSRPADQLTSSAPSSDLLSRGRSGSEGRWAGLGQPPGTHRKAEFVRPQQGDGAAAARGPHPPCWAPTCPGSAAGPQR